MDGSSQVSEHAIRGLNLTLLLLILGVIGRYLYLAWLQYRRGAIYDLEQKEKEDAKRRSKLSDRELVDNANKELGLKRESKTD